MSELLSKTREICRLFEIKPARSKGQNFLINEKIYDDIVAAADLKANDVVVEVGPGLGFLTAKLAAKVKKVIAVELDDRLADYLQIGIGALDIANVEVVNEDILKFNLGAYLRKGDRLENSSQNSEGLNNEGTSSEGINTKEVNVKNENIKYKIVANLPYNITSIFLRQFLSAAFKPTVMILMLQKEVAERICAAPPEMSILAVSVQYYAAPEIIRTVKAGNFWPEPEVDSAVIKMTIHPDKLDEQLDQLDGEPDQLDETVGSENNSATDKAAADRQFFRVVKIGFSAKRKMLKNNLAVGLKIAPKTLEELLEKQGFNPKIRAEDLTLDDWRKLFAALKPFMV